MNVLGPYQFLAEDSEDNCGCGADYCALIQDTDTIAFQIPGSENCCGEQIAGCDEMTTACLTEESIEVELDGVTSNGSVCWDTEDFMADDNLLTGSADFEDNTTYLICFCIANNPTAMTFAAFIDSEESTTVSGNGNFCLRVSTGILSGTFDWGIRVKGGDDTLILCISCISVCQAKTWEANLIDESGSEIAGLTAGFLDNGNQSFELTVLTAEIDPGCYSIKLQNDCNADVLYSQCVKVAVAHSCTLLFKYKDTKNVFGFDYTTDPTYYNYLRLKARLKHPTYPDESGVFRLSDNTNVLTNSVVQKVSKVVLSTPGAPDYVHDAMAVMRRHQEFYIDGVTFVVNEGEYVPNWRKSADLATSIIEVLAQDFDGVNGYCG